MNRNFFKALGAIVVSFVLLYYGIAWAVLGCSHDEEDPDREIALVDGHAVPLSLECVGSDYHTELMAGSSSPSKLHRLKRDIAPDTNGFLTHRTVSGQGAGDVWRRTVFEVLSPLSFPIGLPRYLSLSTLRI